MVAFIKLQQDSFRIQIKCLDFRLPMAEERICVDTKGLCLSHYLLCLAEQGE